VIERRAQAVAIIRITRKQIQAANKAREAALKKNDNFRRFEERRQQRLEEANKAREADLKKELKPAVVPNEEQPSLAASMRRSL
jgi:lysozyme family protein